MPSRRRPLPTRPSTSSWTTTPPTSTRGFALGWAATTGSPSISWLNAVEGFFAKLTSRRLKRGVFVSVVDLQAAINRFVDEVRVRQTRTHHTAMESHQGLFRQEE